ncbi:hypothetical protein NUM3379_16050 [Kineococcus sp. NUM-3379]
MSAEPGGAAERAAVEHIPLVVVGVSSRSGSPSALQWAAEHAAAVGGHVRAVLAWRPPRPPVTSGNRPPAVSTLADQDPQRAAEERLEGLLRAALGEDHAVQAVAVRGAARPVLLRESREADLLVLDSPRAAKLVTPGAKLLAPQLVFSAACPVVVMPPPVEEGLSAVRRAGRRLGRAAAVAAATAGRPGRPPLSPS